MCGISGYHVTRPHAVSAEGLQRLARNLLLEIQSRGRDATGYAYVSKAQKTFGWVKTAKEAVTATEFVKLSGHILSDDRKVTAMPQGMILHTRAATKGSPADNANNHPVYAKKSNLCLVHNGWLVDDDSVIKEFQLKKDAEVDTETYLRLIEKFYFADPALQVERGISEATSNAMGTIACAMIQGGRPETMWLWRDTGSMFLCEVDWGFVFASTGDAAIRALYKSMRGNDLTYFEVVDVPDDTLLRLGPNGIEDSYELEPPEWSTGVTILTWDAKKQKMVPTKRRPAGTRFASTSVYDDDEHWYGLGSNHHGGYNGTQGEFLNGTGPAAHTGPVKPERFGVDGAGARTQNGSAQGSADHKSNEDPPRCPKTEVSKNFCLCNDCTRERSTAQTEKAADEAFYGQYGWYD